MGIAFECACLFILTLVIMAVQPIWSDYSAYKIRDQEESKRAMQRVILSILCPEALLCQWSADRVVLFDH